MTEKTQGTVGAVIVAAGAGRRVGSAVPKQYLPLEGACALRRVVDRFLSLPQISVLVCVVNPGDGALYQEALQGCNDPRLLPPVPGGASRALSVRAGLDAMASRPPAKVLIHDGARPFVSEATIRDVIAALDSHSGATAAAPVVDALWKAEGDNPALASHPVQRDGLWRAQTPQGFDFAAISAAHAHADPGAADDVAVARAAGLDVALIPAPDTNFKITLPEDLDRARALIRSGLV